MALFAKYVECNEEILEVWHLPYVCKNDRSFRNEMPFKDVVLKSTVRDACRE